MVTVSPKYQIPALQSIQREYPLIAGKFRALTEHIVKALADRFAGKDAPRAVVGADGLAIDLFLAGHQVRLSFVGVRLSPSGARFGVVRCVRVLEADERKSASLGDFEFNQDGLATLQNENHERGDRPEIYIDGVRGALWIAAAYLHESVLTT